jgi:tRNA threonylcarbamoyladenosine biosynthesis protein TsaE
MSHLKVVWKSGPFLLDQLDGAARSLWSELQHRMETDESGYPFGVVALQGVMGAGKTTFVRALGNSIGLDGDAVSPTFGLVQCYRLRDWQLFHLDLYRLKDESEAWDLGLTEYFDSDALCLVDWPEKAPGLLPNHSFLLQVIVHGAHDSGARELILSQS